MVPVASDARPPPLENCNSHLYIHIFRHPLKALSTVEIHELMVSKGMVKLPVSGANDEAQPEVPPLQGHSWGGPQRTDTEQLSQVAAEAVTKAREQADAARNQAAAAAAAADAAAAAAAATGNEL